MSPHKRREPRAGGSQRNTEQQTSSDSNPGSCFANGRMDASANSNGTEGEAAAIAARLTFVGCKCRVRGSPRSRHERHA